MTNARFSGWAPWLLASLLAIASAGALAAANTLDVPIATNVKGSTEPVAFAGSARILTRKLLDNVLGSPPVLEIVVDLRPVAAVGVASGNAYVFSGPVILHRPLRPADVIRVTFPYYRAGDIGSARAVEATFDCTFDTATGAVTAVSVSALGL